MSALPPGGRDQQRCREMRRNTAEMYKRELEDFLNVFNEYKKGNYYLKFSAYKCAQNPFILKTIHEQKHLITLQIDQPY